MDVLDFLPVDGFLLGVIIQQRDQIIQLLLELLVAFEEDPSAGLRLRTLGLRLSEDAIGANIALVLLHALDPWPVGHFISAGYCIEPLVTY